MICCSLHWVQVSYHFNSERLYFHDKLLQTCTVLKQKLFKVCHHIYLFCKVIRLYFDFILSNFYLFYEVEYVIKKFI